jgi:hypothetical protein
MATATVMKGGDKPVPFDLQLQRSRDDFASLLSTWDKMTPEQQDACVEEVRVRADELSWMHDDLVERNMQRTSILECLFLVLVILGPLLCKLCLKFKSVDSPDL